LEGTFKDNLVQPPYHGQGLLVLGLFKALSNVTLNISSDGAPTASLGNLLQCL